MGEILFGKRPTTTAVVMTSSREGRVFGMPEKERAKTL
jgi:hypothetical protein